MLDGNDYYADNNGLIVWIGGSTCVLTSDAFAPYKPVLDAKKCRDQNTWSSDQFGHFACGYDYSSSFGFSVPSSLGLLAVSC